LRSHSIIKSLRELNKGVLLGHDPILGTLQNADAFTETVDYELFRFAVDRYARSPEMIATASSLGIDVKDMMMLLDKIKLTTTKLETDIANEENEKKNVLAEESLFQELGNGLFIMEAEGQ